MSRQHNPLTIDRFAEQLAESGCVRTAAEAVGISHSYGRLLFAAIKRALGWQAQ